MSLPRVERAEFDVDRHQRLGVVDHDRAARRQVHRAAEGGLDLVLDLEPAEQRRVVAIPLDPRCLVGHHVVHELLRLVVDVVRVDQDLADVLREVVADRADDERAFLVDQERALAGFGRLIDRVPQLEHVVQVPLQLGSGAPDAGGAGDQAHALGVVKLVEVLFQLFAVFTLDAPADAAAARVVRHQHQVAARQADEGGQCRTLVAALFLFDLDQQFLAVGDGVLDLRVADVDAFLEEVPGDFLERQEAVAVFAVVDEAGLERRFDARHDGPVDVAFALLAPFDLGFEVEELLPIDDCQAPLFLLRGVDQHAFHRVCPCGSTRATDGRLSHTVHRCDARNDGRRTEGRTALASAQARPLRRELQWRHGMKVGACAVTRKSHQEAHRRQQRSPPGRTARG